MLTCEQVRRILRKFPWPEGMGPPGVKIGQARQGGFAIELQRGGFRVVCVEPTTERALITAIDNYLEQHGGPDVGALRRRVVVGLTN